MEDRFDIKHISNVLKDVKTALFDGDSFKLKELSNQTIHSSCISQHRGEILVPVIAYTLSKIVERKDGLGINENEWKSFIKEIGLNINKAVNYLGGRDYDDYESTLEVILKSIESISPDIKDKIKEVLRKAFINKASRLYEHGLSIEHTAGILGITQWELLEYAGQTGIPDIKESISLDVKKRAKLVMGFFS